MDSGAWVTGTDIRGQNLWGTLRNGNQPYINQVGSLVDLRILGNIEQVNWVNATGGASFTVINGTLLTAAQPNITSVGTLDSLSVTGNVGAGNVNTGIIDASGNITSANVNTGQLTATRVLASFVGSANLYSVGDTTTLGNVYTGNVVATGNVYADSLTLSGAFNLAGNTSAANLIVGNITASGNITSSQNIVAVGNIIAGSIETSGISVTGSGTLSLGTGNVYAGGIFGNIAGLSGNIYGTTQSDSTTTGALIVTGGVGIGANIYGGGNITVSGNGYVGTNLTVAGDFTSGNANVGTPDGTNFVFGVTNFKGTTIESDNSSIALFTTTINQIEFGLSATDIEIGALLGNTTINHDLVVSGNIYANLGNVSPTSNIFVHNNLTIENTTIANNLVVSNANVTSKLSIDNVQAGTNAQAGALVVAGGVGIIKNLNVGIANTPNSNVVVWGTTQSTNSTSGALQVRGGAGIVGNLQVAGIANVANTSQSTTTTTGALKVAGGVGVVKDMNVGGNVHVFGDFLVDGTVTLPTIALASVNDTPIGNSIPSSGAFTTLEFTTHRPDARPAFKFDFANNQRLDPRITFTRNTIGTYVSVTGNLTVAAATRPRFHHDSHGQPLGLLIEESRQNLQPYSSEFDNAAWIQAQSSVSSTSGTVGPNGSVSGTYRLTENSANDIHGLGVTAPVTVSLATKYTASVLAKAGTRTQISLIFDSEGTPSIFDLQYGNVASEGASYRSSVDSFANGWYRCSSTVTKTNTSGNVVIALANGGIASYAGDGASYADVYGFQLEEGPFVTSYIPTTTVAVTRDADVVAMTGTNFSRYHKVTQGSLLVDAQIGYRPTDLVPQNQRPVIVSIDDGTASNRVQILAESKASPIVSRGANLVVITGGTVQANLSNPATANLQTVSSGKISGFYNSNQFAFSFNGNTIETDLTGTVATTMNQMTIGSGAGANSLNGTVSKIMYYAKVITTSEAQELSRQ